MLLGRWLGWGISSDCIGIDGEGVVTSMVDGF